MPRKYYRKRYAKKDKYSIETRVFQTDETEDWAERGTSQGGLQQTHQRSFEVVPATNVEGIRKVKHFTLTFTSNSAGELKPLAYALVYVPEGYFENDIKIPIAGNTIIILSPLLRLRDNGDLILNGPPLKSRTP